jgi:hypothetical protein
MITFPNEGDFRAALASARSLEALVETLLVQVSSKPSGPFPVVLLLNEDANAFRCSISPGYDSEFMAILKGARIGTGTTTSAKAVYENAHVYVPDLSEEERDWEDMPTLWWGLVSSWTAPLCTNDGRAFGAFTLYFGSPKRPLSPDKEAFEDFAKCLASVIQAYLR